MIYARSLFLMGMLAAAYGVLVIAGCTPEQEFNLDKIWDANRTAIVKIEVTGKDSANVPVLARQGTGIIVRDSGKILTALHVVGAASDWWKNPDNTIDRRIELTRLDQNQIQQKLGPAQVTEVPDFDIAILDIFATGLGDKSFLETSPGLATRIAALPWNPNSYVPSPQEVRLTLTDKAKYGDRLTIQMNSVIEGNSGAPVFDGVGRVVAIITNKIDGQTALAVPTYLIANRIPPGAGGSAKCNLTIQFGDKLSLHC
jgi:S1-C subfamily serine protease